MSANVALDIPISSRLRPCTPWKKIFLVLTTTMFSLCSSAVTYGAPTALVAARSIDGRSDTLSKATVVVVHGKTIVAIGGALSDSGGCRSDRIGHPLLGIARAAPARPGIGRDGLGVVYRPATRAR